jgi:two-component system chemotaxis sensor kinase CheA
MTEDPYRYFRVEARELVEGLGQGVLELERGGRPADVVPRLMRFAHTLKGAARVVRQPRIAELAHAVEDKLAPHREGAALLPPGRADELLSLVDAIGGQLAQLDAPAGGAASGEDLRRTLRPDVGELDVVLKGIAEVGARLGLVRRALGPLAHARNVAELLAAPRQTARAAESPRVTADERWAVAHELRTQLATGERRLAAAVEQVEQELRQVAQAAERLRLVPAGAMFAALERAARDAAQALGKRVAFEGRGGEVRVDAHVLGVIQNALVQAVRNGVAHGIEDEGPRVAAGKAPAGRITIEVSQHGDQVRFGCHDDGRGVDLEAVRRAATRRGVPPGEIERLGADDLVRLLLEGGISTSGTVSQIAGRGVGLELILEAARRLGGQVSLKTQAGGGTTVELVAPVSLRAVEALLVEAAGRVMAVPASSIRAVLRVSAAEAVVTGGRRSIVHAGQSLTCRELAGIVGTRPGASASPEHWNVIVVDGGAGQAGLVVDRPIGTASLLLRPPPELALADPVVSGTFLDADGNPGVALDPAALVAAARRDEAALGAVEPQRRPPMLVIDDSLTTRMLEQSILESAGYDVDVAASGEEAVGLARRRRYGAFLVDVEMPGMDGFAFLETARDDPALRGVPAILVTSRDAPEDRRRGQELGALAYIVKSEFDQQELLGTIGKLLERCTR